MWEPEERLFGVVEVLLWECSSRSAGIRRLPCTAAVSKLAFLFSEE